MKLIDYQKLDKTKQKEVFVYYAAFVSERQDESYTYGLYQLFDFYVELVYHTELAVLSATRIFTYESEVFLEPYLLKVDLSFIKSS